MPRSPLERVIDCSRAVIVARHAAEKWLAAAPPDDQTEVSWRGQTGQDLIATAEAMLLGALRIYADDEGLTRP